MKYLNDFFLGIKKILTSFTGLDDAKCYHEFCRLLARIKCNYQLSEFIKLEFYSELVDLMGEFTVKSLRMWRFSENSLHYLLSLWQRMVASVPYIKAQEPHLLEKYTPEITSVYINSRLELVNGVVNEGIDDPFDEIGNVYQQLDQISVIGRCEYEKTCSTLANIFDETIQKYEKLFQSSTMLMSENKELNIKEKQLTWLVYITGAVIGGRISYNIGNSDDYDMFDGELIVRILKLMDFINKRLENSNGQIGCENMELAFLNFFEQFNKIFICDKVQKNSKVYQKMAEILGIHDESMWLNVVANKM
jgi:exportin-7